MRSVFDFVEARTQESVGYDTNLAEIGALDSMGRIELLIFIEREFGIEVSDSEAQTADLSSVCRITDFVCEEKSKQHCS